MSDHTCDRCKLSYSKDIPKPGLSKFWGTVKYKTWQIRFNYLRMNTWENATTASEVIQSSTYSEIELCSECWSDVLHFINTTKTKDYSCLPTVTLPN